MVSSPRSKALFAALLLASLVGGCADYLNNRDTVSFRAGDAQNANTAIQEIEPWPPSAYKTTVGHGG
ncbi:hypothetical protein PGB28_04035 [Primorskyibacter aestuariivivens]|uniref:hypothetical protein n=1 Tax=Primorskyibacter aestuariivivens TaxID=1888912 RepID=UPI002301E274|nr:hypothetical protein [Primorskyibacter aestuariivivens]MDA7427616.1 hypothetical protein [Primorskyibacter aestuariivivens]